MNEFTKRLLMGSLAILVTLGLLPFAYAPFAMIVIYILFAGLGCFALKEYLQFCEAKEIFPPQKTLLIGLSCFLAASFFNTYVIGFQDLSVLVLVIFIFAMFILHYKKPSHSLVHIATSTFGLIYVAVPLGMMIQILYPTNMLDGRLWLMYLIVVTKIADIAAYFVGKTIGRTPLSPNLSPKKTVEGFIGGLVFAFATSIAFYGYVQTHLFGVEQISLGGALVLGLLLPIIGQFGDLSESLMKRDANLDDSGKLPGLGGVLDLIDSLLFTAPTLYFYIRMITTF